MARTITAPTETPALTEGTWIVSAETGTAASFGQVVGDMVNWEVGACSTPLEYEVGTATVCEDCATAETLWEERRKSDGRTKPPAEHRVVRIVVQVTAFERAEIGRIAAAAGKTISAHLRDRALAE